MIISIKDYEREFGRDPEKDMKEHTIVRINDKEYIIDNVTHTVTYRFFGLIRMRGGSVEFSEIKRTPDKFCICCILLLKICEYLQNSLAKIRFPKYYPNCCPNATTYFFLRKFYLFYHISPYMSTLVELLKKMC